MSQYPSYPPHWSPIFVSKDTDKTKTLANALRFLALDMVEKAQSGHPGMPMGMAEIATVLYKKFLKFDPKNPLWPDRDRFVLSNGHGSALLYALSYLSGYEDMTLDQLKTFRQLGSHTPGHPEVHPALGIETTTGPLGQGLANAVGMALAERHLNAQFGDDLVDHQTYAFVGDGCLMEGISQEAISLAGHLGLHKLTVFFDDNAITIDGATALSGSDDTLGRFQASHWHVQTVNGHDPRDIEHAIDETFESQAPSLIICKTTIGYGAPTKAGTAAVHGAPLGAEEVEKTRKALQWPYGPFEIPEAVLNMWRDFGDIGNQQYKVWESRLARHPHAQEFQRRQEKQLPSSYGKDLDAFKQRMVKEAPTLSTRKASEEVLSLLAPHIPELVGGSADLTGSNNTKAPSMRPLSKGHYGGTYIHYGVREHAMAAIMNGLALHGGIIPYGGTFLVFSDYCRPALRLSALMEQRVIYVMTHDSIGLGEDGPTHQPVEHLASLRLIPGLLVFRPADAIETAECWDLALKQVHHPSVLALTRQNVPTVRNHSHPQCHRGLYLLDAHDPLERLEKQEGTPKEDPTLRRPIRDICFMASGSEVSLAQEVAALLQKTDGITSWVVSAPCLELFQKQPVSYQQALLTLGRFRVAIEMGTPQCWSPYLRPQDLMIGMKSFGASGPYKDLYKHFGFTAEQIHLKIKNHLQEVQKNHDREISH